MALPPFLPVILFIFLYLGLLIWLSWIDYWQQLLPDNLTYLLLWTGLLYQSLFAPQFILPAVLGAIFGYCCLWLINRLYRLARCREGIGYGDMKLLAALGVWHGYAALGWILFVAAMGGLAGVGLKSLLQRKNCFTNATPLPFGPCLAIAAGSIGWLDSTHPMTSLISWLL